MDPKPIYWDVDVEMSMENSAWLLGKVARRLTRRAKARRRQTAPPEREALAADLQELRWNFESCERIERELHLVALHLAGEQGDFEAAREVRRVVPIVAEIREKIREQIEEAALELEALEEEEDDDGDEDA